VGSKHLNSLVCQRKIQTLPSNNFKCPSCFS
jgi:hypothetical protein